MRFLPLSGCAFYINNCIARNGQDNDHGLDVSVIHFMIRYKNAAARKDMQ